MKTILPFMIDAIEHEKYLRVLDSFATLCTEVAPYLLHIKGDTESTDLALKMLKIADGGFGFPFSWPKLHYAFAYQKKLAEAKKQGNAEDIEKYYNLAMKYSEKPANNPKDILWNTDNQSLHLLPDNEGAKLSAFSLCIKALAQYEHGDLQTAISTYRAALDIYEKNKLIDDQYTRAKNRWAMMLVENKEIEKAAVAFSEVKEYWKKADKDNPYIVRFLSVYTDFLEKENKLLKEQIASAKQEVKQTPTNYSPLLFAAASTAPPATISHNHPAIGDSTNLTR